MEEEQKGPARFWPMVFIGAFLLGAILWGAWMYNIVRKTKEQRENRFFVPEPTQVTNEAGKANR